ncbi:MAG: hypothetical protein H0T48_07860 [Gemmatimonadaceae bacterium]|nr:hypothetical protein [Gemmatimonadaceae bacterium]
MRSNLAASMVYLAAILISFGAAICVIAFLGARYGDGNESAELLGAGLLVGGAIVAGTGFLLRRDSANRTSSG